MHLKYLYLIYKISCNYTNNPNGCEVFPNNFNRVC